MLGNCYATFKRKEDGKFTYTNDTANICIFIEAIRHKKDITKKYINEWVNYFYDYEDYYHVPNTLVKKSSLNELFSLDKMPVYSIDLGYYLLRDEDIEKFVNDLYALIFDLNPIDLPKTYRYMDSLMAAKLVTRLCNHQDKETLKEYFNKNKEGLTKELKEAFQIYLDINSFEECLEKVKDLNNEYIMALSLTLAEYTYPYIDNQFYVDFIISLYHTQMLKEMRDYLCFRDDIFVDIENINKNSKFLLYAFEDRKYNLVPSDSLQGLSNDLVYYQLRSLFYVEFDDLLDDLYDDKTIQDYLQCLAHDVYINDPEMYNKLYDFSDVVLDFLKCNDKDKFMEFLDEFNEILKLHGYDYKVLYFDNPYDLVKYYCEHDMNRELYNAITKELNKTQNK